jgi:hypothetical protein
MISIFSFSISFVLSFIFRTLKINNKKYKIVAFFISVLQYFNIIFIFYLIISIFIYDLFKIETNINKDLELFHKHKIVLKIDKKDCLIQPTIINKNIYILKEECKTKDFKNIKAIKTNSDFSSFINLKNSFGIVIFYLSFLILYLSNKKNEDIEKFNERKASLIFTSLIIIIFFVKVDIYISGLISVLLILFSKIRLVENNLGKENNGLLISFINHFKLICFTYSINNIIEKEEMIYIIKQIDASNTKIESLLTGEEYNISTTELFSYNNTHLICKDNSINRIDFDFKIEKNKVKNSIKINILMESLINDVLPDKDSFYLMSVNKEDEVFFTFKIILKESNKIKTLKKHLVENLN